jgi:predicted nucleotidyltransferase
MDAAVERELELIRDSVLAVVPDTEAIYLFGSYARGEPNEDSDLDIYVVVPDQVENPMEKVLDIRLRMAARQRMALDLLAGKSSMFHRRAQGPTMERAIARDGRLLYGA